MALLYTNEGSISVIPGNILQEINRAEEFSVWPYLVPQTEKRPRMYDELSSRYTYLLANIFHDGKWSLIEGNGKLVPRIPVTLDRSQNMWH